MAAELKIDSVYAELMPEDKVQLLEEFCNDRMENEKLAFVGDGMNDAPVLALADIGIAMGGLAARMPRLRRRTLSLWKMSRRRL